MDSTSSSSVTAVHGEKPVSSRAAPTDVFSAGSDLGAKFLGSIPVGGGVSNVKPLRKQRWFVARRVRVNFDPVRSSARSDLTSPFTASRSRFGVSQLVGRREAAKASAGARAITGLAT